MPEIHSKTGASSMERWEPCPGSVRLSRTVPEPSSTSYAEEGTQAHTFAADWLQSGREPAFPNEEMRDNVKLYVDLCNRFYTPSHQQLGAVRGIEYFFDVSDKIPGMYSTADFWVFWPWLKKLVVIDFKYGAGVFVPVVENVQLQYYAAGVLLSNPTFFEGVDTIEVGVCQPRCMANTEEDPFRLWEVDRFTIEVFTERIRRAIQATQDPDAPLKSGDHCRWCPAAAVCPELQAEKDRALQGTFAVIPQRDQVYDVRALAKALKQRDAIKAYLSALDSFAYEEAIRGVQIPDHKLVAKQGQRRYVDEANTINHFKAAGIPDATLFEPKKLKSPAQLEKAMPHYKKILELHTKTESSGYSLVSEDDPRPAISHDPTAVFSTVTATPTLEDLGL